MAERERLTLLHYHGDYDLTAQVTGQSSAMPPRLPCRGRRPNQLIATAAAELAMMAAWAGSSDLRDPEVQVCPSG